MIIYEVVKCGYKRNHVSTTGRKSACQVQIDKSGFSLQHIRICEGQVVTFTWEEHEGQGFNVTQVCQTYLVVSVFVLHLQVGHG